MTDTKSLGSGEVVAKADLPELRRRHADKRIVLATGCFDIVHKGHVYFLREAARRGDVLVVGVNSDKSVRALKGHERPIVSEIDRCAVLAEFGCVDYVFTYDERDSASSIALLLPNVFVVGAASVAEYPDEIQAAQDANAQLLVMQRSPSRSTTDIIVHIRTKAAPA